MTFPTDSAYGQWRVTYVWADGSRIAKNNYGKVCIHKPVAGEPIGYSAWHEWAPRYGKKHRQVPCPNGCPILVWVGAS